MIKILIAGTALMLITAPAVAQTTEPVPAPVAQPPKERMLCKRTENPGSRIPGKKVCRTASEWDNLAREEQDNFKRQVPKQRAMGPG